MVTTMITTIKPVKVQISTATANKPTKKLSNITKPKVEFGLVLATNGHVVGRVYSKGEIALPSGAIVNYQKTFKKGRTIFFSMDTYQDLLDVLNNHKDYGMELNCYQFNKETTFQLKYILEAHLYDFNQKMLKCLVTRDTALYEQLRAEREAHVLYPDGLNQPIN